MIRVLVACVGVAAALNASNTPTCSVNGAAGGQVVTFSDGTYQRCMSVITPSSAKKPMPILWWFHGSGGNAAHCGDSKLVALAESTGFAFICGEATQDVFGHGGQWNIPAKITDETGTPCSSSDSVEVNYMKNALANLAKSPQTYDMTRVFTSGCSMGSAFSGYMGNCLKLWDPTQISAFATHSTGLKVKGDGNHLPENWGECTGCKYWPFAPVKYTDKLGLKACVFDNTGDGDFYKTSEYLAKEWPKLGNPSESHFASGGHCQNIPYADIVKCLGISGSSTPSPISSSSGFPAPAGSMAVSSSSYDLGGFLCGKQEPTCNIYYPTQLDKGPFPIATFGHGMGGIIIEDLVKSVASLGFVVVAPATSGGKCDDSHYKDMLHALEGSKAKPSLHEALGHVDWNRSAIFGHSMGGFATILAAAEAMKDPAKYNVRAIVASHGYIGDATKEAATITVPAMFTTGSEDRHGAIKGQFDATPGRPKVLAQVTGASHMEPAINGRLNPFDAHFLGCHVAGLQTSCDKVYGSGADDMCQANTMTLCQTEKDGLLMV